MKSFFNKLEDKVSSFSQEFLVHDSKAQQPIQQQHQSSTILPPTPDDVFRYRYHHGTNLGSVFVLEKWLSGHMFLPSSNGDSELDAVTASVKERGIDETRRIWEDFWKSAVTDDDWEWLKTSARCTSIRLPVGWWIMGGPDLPQRLHGTAWDGLEGVYCNAWAIVRELVATAHHHGIGVLVDLHGLPGGANGEAHSGTSSGTADLWGDKKNLELAKCALHFMASEIRNGMQGVAGLQIVNESVYDAKGMYEFYDQAIDIIGSVDESIPIYVSDGWDLPRCLGWTGSRNPNTSRRCPIVIDTHRYFTFSDKDRSQSPQEIIDRIPEELAEVNPGGVCDHGEAQVVIGEWSNVLDGQTWSRSNPDAKDALVHAFGQAESHQWHAKSGGSFFWTWKMDWMDGGEWGFVEQTKRDNIFIPPFLFFPPQEIQARLQHAHQRRGLLSQQARGGHEGYWNQASPGQPFEHHLFSEGWEVGFSDAAVFFGARVEGKIGGGCGGCGGGDRIGCVEIWVKKRLLESGLRGKFTWEWEQGLRAGIQGFEQCVGI
ncbi:glycoside hydrolase superfamily [Amylocarpus encephaloides]|uniref:Glycoside hydrolase superfamily n=1 Tax=Amylocarpus encephaloides TaxID=45428 RepID=A0A9P7Y9L7_9HELO|nr:glycoside hydrolase superfamily [Amylocarpus encephaloides]